MSVAPAESVVRQTTADQLFAVLRERILGHVLPAGVHLIEAEIAREFRVSTTPVREALQRLVQVGLADRQAARGITVHRPTAAELRDLFELRMLLEPAGLKDSARSMDEAGWTALEEILAAAKAAIDAGQAGVSAELNSRFHRGLVGRARNRILRDTLNGLADRHRLGSLYGWSVVNHSVREWGEHCEILGFARRGEIDRAAELLRDHISRYMDSTVATLERVEHDRGELPALHEPAAFAPREVSA
ncbi:MAG: GntR family transcriptional regulator [Rhodoplanes sp.]|uniref:GntR family transcriptional regulator n=1 Tax=Rhodoplanes sp. TaxID=1968906 RepID=UPI0017F2A457|nr:GntR family transcriptional regulator [Rhodoplanes sp.]NVO12628.1 GntR family transcriptional regulator [Rhodoplanes sp.]